MQRVVRFLADLVRMAPGLVVAITVLLTAGLGMVAPKAVLAEGNDTFSPNNAEIKALERAQDLFQGDDQTNEAITQTLVKGEDVVTADALRAVFAIEEQVRSSRVGDLVSDQLEQAQPRPAFVSYLGGVVQAAIAQGLDPAALTDAQVKEFYEASLESEQGAFLAALLARPDGAEPAEAGLVLTFWDVNAVRDAVRAGRFEGLAAEQDSEFEFAGLARAHEVAQEVVVDLDEQLTGDLDLAFLSQELIFADESFLDEIQGLFLFAGGIILLILGFVYWLRPQAGYGVVPATRRTVSDVLLTLFTIMASITWMQGLSVVLGPGYLDVILGNNPVTQIIPILLIGLGVDYAIHMTSRYREALGEGGDADAAAAEATRTVGVALALATVTTVLGFLTNLLNPVPALRDFGILSAIGILVAFLLTLTFVPAVRILLDRRAEARGVLPRQALAGTSERLLPALMARTSVLAVHHSGIVLGATLGFAVLGAVGLANLSTDFSFVDFVPDDTAVVRAYDDVDEYFGGGFSETTSILVEGDVATPAVHNAMVRAQTEGLAEVPDVVAFGGQPAAESVVSHLFGLLTPGPDGAVNEEFVATATSLGLDPATLLVGDGTDVAALYDATLAADPGLADVVSVDDGRYVATLIEVNTQAGMDRAFDLAQGLRSAYADVEAAGEATVTPTSISIVSETIRTELNSSQISSLLVTLAAATALLAFVMWRRHRKPMFGVVTVLPVGFVLLWTFGLMTLTGISFNPMTSMISALAIGIGVPFTIHVAHRFEEDLHRETDPEVAIASTLRHTGGALAGSAFTTMAGFAILVTASIAPFRQLGLVVTYAIGFALVASVLVLPSMLLRWYAWDAKRSTPLGADVVAIDPASEDSAPAEPDRAAREPVGV